jgi:hypothetical protein
MHPRLCLCQKPCTLQVPLRDGGNRHPGLLVLTRHGLRIGFKWGERAQMSSQTSAVQKCRDVWARVLGELFDDQALFQPMAGVKQNAVAHIGF